MKQVGIRDAQVNLTKLLNDLPFEITRFGKIVAQVFPPNYGASEAPQKPSIDELRTLMETVEKEHWGNPKLHCNICQTSPAIGYTYQDENSDPHEAIWCKKHIEQYEHEHAKSPTIELGGALLNQVGDLSSKFIPIPKPKKKK